MPKLSYCLPHNSGNPPAEVSFFPATCGPVSLVQLMNLGAELWPGVPPNQLLVSPGLNCFYFGPGPAASGLLVPDLPAAS